MDATALKAKLAALPESTPEAFRVRCHRAISWLRRAEAESEDPDAAFLFLWVGLNAAYAWDFGHEERERDQLRRFFERLVALDRRSRLQALFFEKYSGPVRTLIDNRFVFEPFWRALREHDASGAWETAFSAAKSLALRALMDKQTALLAGIVIDRLYVLRNQLVHGGATHGSMVNRQQVKDGVALLGSLLPLVIDLMLDAPNQDFGPIAYPVIQGIR
jgi:hypothetical protein